MTGFRFSKWHLHVLSFAFAAAVLANPVPAQDDKKPPKTIAKAKASPVTTVQGTVVDDKTGEPVTSFLIQAGKVESEDPLKITWGYSQRRSSAAKKGKYQAYIRWHDGWTARVLADGYLPYPIVTKAPPKKDGTLNLEIRLKRGQLIRGRVLDHDGKPVSDAAVFAIGPTGLHVSGKASVDSWNGKPDGRTKPVLTDGKGQFEIPAGSAESLAVSTNQVDAWESDLPKDGEELLIKLPEPGQLTIRYQIDGAGEKTDLFLQLLSHKSEDFKKLYWQKKLSIKNGEQLVLKNLPPASYDVCRYRMLRTGQMGMGRMLDRTHITIVSGKEARVEFTRPNGKPVKGRVTGIPDDVPVALVFVKAVKEDGEVERFDLSDGLTVDKTGEFTTEPLLPGKYLFEGEGYPPLTPDEQRTTGIRSARYKAKLEFTVPASGTVEPIELKLVDTQKPADKK